LATKQSSCNRTAKEGIKVYRNTIDVSSMDIPRHTAIDLLFASSVVAPTPPQVVNNQTTLLPHAPYAPSGEL
jgi:hypothetical protein